MTIRRFRALADGEGTPCSTLILGSSLVSSPASRIDLNVFITSCVSVVEEVPWEAQSADLSVPWHTLFPCFHDSDMASRLVVLSL